MSVRTWVVACTAAALLALPGIAAATTADGVDVTGSVWLDLDGDGRQGDGEPGRSGVQVTLRTSAAILDAVTTDSDGAWRFGDVPPGTYTVTIRTPIDLDITGGTLAGLDADEGAGSLTVGGTDIAAGSVGLGSGVTSGPDVTAAVGLDPSTSTAAQYVWRVGVHNIGPDDADGPIDVRVVLSAGHTAESASGDGWGCERSDAILLCSTDAGLAAGDGLPSLQVVSIPTADVGTTVTTTATVRLDGTFDAAPLNDEGSAEVVVSTELAAADIDGDGEEDLTNAGAPVLALALLATIALTLGSTAVLRPHRT